MLPILIPSIYFKKIDSLLSKFLWKNKKSRISLSQLRKPKSNGGVNFPEFRIYRESFYLRQASKWLLSESSPFTPLWLTIEHCLLMPFSTNKVLAFSSKTFQNTLPLFKHTCSLLRPLTQLKITSRESFLHSPIWHNRLITTNNRPIFWKSWRLRGVTWSMTYLMVQPLVHSLTFKSLLNVLVHSGTNFLF